MGGAGGHMWHPFDCPDVNSGQDLIDFFRKSVEWAKTNKPALKIDGVNLSFRVRENPDMPTGYEFVVDRGSMKDLDVQGVTADNANQRFVSKPFDPEFRVDPGGVDDAEGEFVCPEDAEVIYVGLDNKMMCLKEHGMVGATRILLPIFNDALPDILEELQQLGMLEDFGPYSKYFNTEFVLKQINVKEYAFDFIAIHSINDFVKKGPKSRMGVETDYDQIILDRLKDKVKSHALKKEFRIYTSITTDTVRDVALEKALSENFTIVYSSQMRDSEEPGELGIGEGSTKSIEAWLADVSENPLKKPILISDGMIEKYPKMNKKQFAMAKNIYIEVLKGTAVNEIVDSPEFIEPVVDGAVIWHATRQLGNAVLDSLESEEFGPASDQEGVVIKDPDICGGTRFKFTGDFIVGGLASDFQEQKFRQGKLLESFAPEAAQVREDVDRSGETGNYVILIPGGFKPPTGGHYSMIKQYEKNSDVAQVFVITGPKPREGVTLQQSREIFDIYGGFSDKVEFISSNDPTPLRTCYELMGNEEFINKFPGAVFSIGASNKGGDPERIRQFVSYFEKRPDLTNANIAAYRPAEAHDVDGKPASASRMRAAFQNGDWSTFKKLLPDDNFYNDVIQVLNQQVGGQVNENFFSMDSLFSLVNEVSSEKQRRWACAQIDDPDELTKKQAKEMCTSKIEEQQINEADESQLRAIISNLLTKFLSNIPEINNAAALQANGMEYERDVQEPIVNTIMTQINRIATKLKRDGEEELVEMSSMAGGAVAGFSGPIGVDDEDERRSTSRA